MTDIRKRKRVPFSVRDTVIRKNNIYNRITKLVVENYEPEKIHNLKPDLVKQSSFIINGLWFITNHLKHLVHLEGTKGCIEGGNYVSYTPVKLLKLIDSIMLEVFGEIIDLDTITPEHIMKAERYFEACDEKLRNIEMRATL
ncbi:hypothetical protein [Pseudomonas sp. MF4836]|uniref:hypothetical protein n=1 Tax=Pseudomonas sp. MF4836 TaxID=1960827 RepID=UPI00128FE2C8|nr:hypothetical protein [Pseudomonas sp. MF4836]